MKKATLDKVDAYDLVTEKIVEALEGGTVPWRRPWTQAGTFPLSMSTNKPYRGINVLLLSLVGSQYTNPYWGTYLRIGELGGQVRRGEKSTPVVKYKKLNIMEKQPDGTTEPKSIFMAKTFRVFNADQADWPEGSKKPVVPELAEHDPIEAAEAVVTYYPNPPKITRTISDRAFYVPSTDEITVPIPGQYKELGEFYSTLFHELGHSTGHKSRLNRKELMTFSHFGDALYSKEELTAEMTAAFLCAHAGIEVTLDNSAAYIASWLTKLGEDKQLVVRAASQAQKAADYVLGVTQDNGDEEKVAA